MLFNRGGEGVLSDDLIFPDTTNKPLMARHTVSAFKKFKRTSKTSKRSKDRMKRSKHNRKTRSRMQEGLVTRIQKQRSARIIQRALRNKSPHASHTTWYNRMIRENDPENGPPLIMSRQHGFKREPNTISRTRPPLVYGQNADGNVGDSLPFSLSDADSQW